MGQCCTRCLCAGLCRLHRADPGTTCRDNLLLPVCVREPAVCSCPVAGRSADDSLAPVAERVATHFCIFHDFRPKNDARLTRRPSTVWSARRGCCGVCPVWSVQTRRTCSCAGLLLPTRAPDRRFVAWRTVPVVRQIQYPTNSSNGVPPCAF